MPRNLMSVLLDSSKRDPGRSKVLYEIHYRMPQKLSGPFSATHFVQLRRTAEDIAFEQEQKKFELLFDIGEKEATKTNVYGSVFPKKTSHLDSRDGLADAYRYIFKQHNDLFIFGAPETVIDLVARHVIDKKGHSTGLDDEITILYRLLGNYLKINLEMRSRRQTTKLSHRGLFEFQNSVA